MPSGSPARRSMRPSWPLPSTQTGFMRPPADRGGSRRLRSAPDASPPNAAPARRRAAPDLHRQQPGVGGAGFADRQRAHRNAARHLHDGVQAVYAAQRGALHRHTQHRHRVFAASMPGRCAAPPAPAMITSKPLAVACSAKLNSLSGVRWAETTSTWKGLRAGSGLRRRTAWWPSHFSIPLQLRFSPR